ncbi:CLEC4E isoform 4, partial [Pan troglodytes]
NFTELSCYNYGSGSVKNCCPLNWEYFQSSCYFFSTDTISWALSLKNCSAMGAHLVVINSQEEQLLGCRGAQQHSYPGGLCHHERLFKPKAKLE